MNYSIEQIKQEIPMNDIVEMYGVKVRKGMCCCPFHDDHHPSMKVYKNSFHCFACGAHGDIFDWIQRMDTV